ncbi:UNVERIFIED_CONTAM: hypothetical protein Slati_1112300 [Sesamum latifolium]|uniref:Uncharacterized protein n=1 Tax=Sesamum latifolium TaxID=2727402 RepID=A0AAW2XBH1_9LAMI
MEVSANQANGGLNPSLKLAIAVAIAESRRRQKLPAPPAPSTAACDNSESDAIKWKRKV